MAWAPITEKVHYMSIMMGVFFEMRDKVFFKEHGYSNDNKRKHERDFGDVLFQMTQNILEKRVERGIIRCEACDEWCKADCAHTDAPIEHGCHTIMRNDWLICNHYMCRNCINALINQDRPVYTCDVCDEDITWWLQELRTDDDWWEIDDDEEYMHNVQQDIDSGAETDDEDRHIVMR